MVFHILNSLDFYRGGSQFSKDNCESQNAGMRNRTWNGNKMRSAPKVR